jgi:hypothetical protein
MRAAMDDYMGLGATIGAPHISIEQVEKLAPATARAAEPIVSLCLYLCSEEPDVAGMLPKMPEQPVHPSPVRVKGGEKTFAADSPRIWGTGWRLGAILRTSRKEANEPEPKEALEGMRGDADPRRIFGARTGTRSGPAPGAVRRENQL